MTQKRYITPWAEVAALRNEQETLVAKVTKTASEELVRMLEAANFSIAANYLKNEIESRSSMNTLVNTVKQTAQLA